MENEYIGEDPIVEDYRPFSFASLVAVLISLITAVLAFINPNLVILCFLAIVMSMVLVIRIALRRQVSGHILTGLALFISVFAFAGTITYRNVQHAYQVSIAREYARLWLDLVVDGKVFEPHQLTKTVEKRESDGTNLREAMGSYFLPEGEELDGDIKIYARMQPEATIRRLGDSAEFEDLGLVAHTTRPFWRDLYQILFKMKSAEIGERTFAINMQRQYCLEPWGVQWHVEQVINVDPEIKRSEVGRQKRWVE